MEFLELKIAELSQSKNLFVFLQASCLLCWHCRLVFKLFHYFYKVMGTFAHKSKILA